VRSGVVEAEVMNGTVGDVKEGRRGIFEGQKGGNKQKVRVYGFPMR
jgi:hypothetical protein